MKRFGAARAAVGFLTTLPVSLPSHEKAWARAPAWFAIVGGAIGCVLASVWILLGDVSAPVRAWLIVALGVLLTGALHEDGLADTADALGGGARDPARALEIMKDPAIGTFGALALIFSVGLRATLLGTAGPAAAAALIASHAFSRGMLVPVMVALPHAGDPARQRTSAMAAPSTSEALFAKASMLILLALLWGVGGWSVVTMLIVALGMIVVSGVATRWLRAWLGGRTGDTLGALQQSLEVVVLAAAVLT